MPETAKIVDKLCIVRSLYTEAINHDPAVTFLQTGSERAGRPSMGAWLSYGLGSLNADLPEFFVLITKDKSGQPLYQRLWGAGFLAATHSRRCTQRANSGKSSGIGTARPAACAR